jgi:hypothetical protein
LERIDESLFVVADITYLNLNVVYEIGFTIGSGKRAFLVRHSSTEGDRETAKQAGIFDTLGFHAYADRDELVHRLTSHIDPTPLHFQHTPDTKAPVYIVEPPVRGDAATLMVSRLKKAGYRYRSFAPSEDSRLSANDAVRQVAASAGILLALLPVTQQWSQVHNVRALFVAGLADGMDKPLLVLCPHNHEAPVDIRDEVKTFQRPEDIVEHISTFVPRVAEYLQQTEPAPAPSGTSLQSLEMGDPTAENEMTTLADYYLATDEYSRTVRGEVNLVVGRKGSGKTALFIQVRDNKRADKRNIVVDLKPEGYQLIKLKEDILQYLLEGSRQHLITAFWEYLILLEVAYKLLEKDQHSYKYNHQIHDLYRELQATYRTEKTLSEGDFSERLLTLSQRISSDFQAQYGSTHGQRLSNDEIARLLYRHDVRDLQVRISRYLEKKHSVWILFDNLDKGWSTQGIDAIDSIALRCLIDAGRKIERDMRKSDHAFHCIVFVRNDVYEHLMQHSSDYGKEMRAVLDWTDPDLLRKMLGLRLTSGLRLDRGMPFSKVWPMVCVSHIHGEESSAFILERSLMRPRNVLRLFGYAKSFANNFSRLLITEDDIEKGFKAYSQDLLVDLGHELVDVFPEAKDLLYYFLDSKSEMSLLEIYGLLEKAGVDEADFRFVMEFLMYYGVIGLRIDGADQYIYNVHYDSKVLQIRAELAGEKVRFVINPAFFPALGTIQ